MRAIELISELSHLQRCILDIEVYPNPEEYHTSGFVLLRACITEAEAILATPYPCDTFGDTEAAGDIHLQQ